MKYLQPLFMRLLVAGIMLLLSACSLFAYRTNNAKEDINRFLSSGEYEQYTQFRYVPKHIVDYLSKQNGEPFKAGDRDDTTVNFSDARLGNDLDKRVNFVLLGKDCNLICYDQGGIGRNTVIDFFDEAHKLRCAHTVSIEPVNDVAALRSYLHGANFIPWDDDKNAYH